jgi:hypothetical protein
MQAIFVLAQNMLQLELAKRFAAVAALRQTELRKIIVH